MLKGRTALDGLARAAAGPYMSQAMTERRKPEIADIDEDPNVEIGPYSSPPCYAHEVDPAYFGLPAGEGDPGTRLRKVLDAVREASAILTSLGAER